VAILFLGCSRYANNEDARGRTLVNGADKIYPSWSIFEKTIKEPKIRKEFVFVKAQEVCRKDIKRDSGALQA
jgi:hypothetical protein